MDMTDRDFDLVAVLCDGLPLTPRPFAALAAALGMDEDEVIGRIRDMTAAGLIRRFGVVVRHRELGYRANAMVVWDIPDSEVDAAGRRLGDCPEVTLCYRRPRRLPDWPYNLFTMIHGHSRPEVEAAIAAIADRTGLGGYRRDVLFSARRFKQCGARYGHRAAAE
jgi:DNA-binding Lrp family transcriptional regulator